MSVPFKLIQTSGTENVFHAEMIVLSVLEILQHATSVILELFCLRMVLIVIVPWILMQMILILYAFLVEMGAQTVLNHILIAMNAI